MYYKTEEIKYLAKVYITLIFGAVFFAYIAVCKGLTVKFSKLKHWCNVFITTAVVSNVILIGKFFNFK